MLFWYHLPIPFFQNLSTVLLLSNVHKLWLLLSLTLMQFFKRPLLFYQRSNMRKCKSFSTYWIISHYYYSKYIQRNVTTFVGTLIPYFNVLKTKIIAKISKPRSIKICYISLCVGLQYLSLSFISCLPGLPSLNLLHNIQPSFEKLCWSNKISGSIHAKTFEKIKWFVNDFTYPTHNFFGEIVW